MLYRPTAGPSRDRSDDVERLDTARDCIGEQVIRIGQRNIVLAGKEPDERPALVRHMIAKCALQRRVCCFQGIEDGANRNRRGNLQRHFPIRPGKDAQMSR